MNIYDKEYMIKNYKNKSESSINIKNFVLVAACEATELFYCMIQIDNHLDDWHRFIKTLNKHLEKHNHHSVNDLCQSIYSLRHNSEHLEGIFMILNDSANCHLYYQIFIGFLELILNVFETINSINTVQ